MQCFPAEHDARSSIGQPVAPLECIIISPHKDRMEMKQKKNSSKNGYEHRSACCVKQ